MTLAKTDLELFSQKERRKHKIQAAGEALFALTPMFALIFGLSKLSTNPAGRELMSPDKFGLIHILIILASVSYLIFLFFIIKDIKRRLAIR